MAPPVGNTPEHGTAGERIAKLLARAGVASRREIERMIAEGRVAREGVVIDRPATLLGSLHGVTVDGAPVAQPAPARLFLYHKPTGLLVTERDPRGRPTIYDRLPKDLPRVVPVGRLDLNTEGLLLLTTDGGLKRQLELPASGVERSYRARAYGAVTQARLEDLMEGVEVDGVRYGPIDANLERRTGANVWIELTLTEGKNREVRRVLEHLGLQVGRLIRTRYGPFVLGDLPPGAVGEVRQADLVAFRQTLAARRREAPDRGAVRPVRREQGAPAAQSRRVLVTEAREERSRGTTPAARDEPAARSIGPRASQPRPMPSPGERRGPTATPSVALRPPVPPKPAARRGEVGSAPNPGPGLRRAGAQSKASSQHKGEIGGEPSSPRPAKLQRKPGWAKPKPKSGPARPRKPRA